MTSFFNSKAMKKIFRLFAAFAAVTMAFSCMEEANPEMPSTSGTTYEGPTVTLKFNIDKLETKTIWEDDVHDWVNGDKVKIVYPIGEKVWESEATIYKDKGVWGAYAEVGEADTYYAVYPATSAYTFTTPEGATESQFTVVIPQTQDGSFGQANIMVAKTDSEELSFSFKNVTHIFKFTLSEDSAYKGFQFMSNSSENYISGGAPVAFDEPFNVGDLATVTINETKYSQSSIVQVGNLEKGGTYYIGIHPGADMSYGFGFKATKQQGTTGWSEGALSTSAVDVDRLKITSIANLDKAIRPNLFFKEKASGNGDGSDWENAGDVNLLVKLLGSNLIDGETSETSVKYNKQTNGWRLYGAKLHLAGGTYELPTTIEFLINVNNRTAVYGGYPSDLTGTSLDGREAKKYETIITKDGGTRLFSGNGSTLYDWTWDGITFTLNEGTTTTYRGGAFYLNNSTKGTLKFNNCTFKNIESTDTNGGGVICINTQTNDAKLTFTNCDFINNKTAKVGGAVFIQDGRKATLTFKGCNFTGNNATSAGGAIGNCVGTIIVDGCTFKDNYSTAHGGAICTYGEGLSDNATITGQANAYIYNSLFDNNDVSSTSQGGSIKAHGNGNLVVVNSTFRNSSASTGIIRLRSQVAESVKAWVIGCTFSDNNKNSFYNQSSLAYIYNTVMNDPSSFIANQTTGGTSFWNTIVFNTSYYNIASGELPGKNALTTLTDIKTLDATVVGGFENGVYSVTGAALTDGMSSADLAALGEEGSALMTAMPLFDTEKLTVDQKGTSREGKKIMGAYVGE